jgi:hypothetical protein
VEEVPILKRHGRWRNILRIMYNAEVHYTHDRGWMENRSKSQVHTGVTIAVKFKPWSEK